MSTRSLILPVLILLAGCDASPPSETPAWQEAPAAPAPEPSRAGIAFTSVGELSGEYRVAGIDSRSLDITVGIALSIDGPMMSLDPVCAGFVWNIAFEDAQLITKREQPAGANSPDCTAAILPEHTALAEVLDAATRVERTPANGILLSGGGRSATLFSQ